MGNNYDSNAFMNNFVRGFSFVDEIKQRKINNKRLEDQLAEQKNERSFQRQRTLEGDAQVRDNRRIAKSERDRVANERDLRDQGDREAIKGEDADESILTQSAPYSESAKAELLRRNNTKRINKALSGAQTIPTLGSQVTGQPGNKVVAPSDTVAPGADKGAGISPTAQAQAAEQQGFNFAPARGASSRQDISEEEFNKYSEAYQDKGFFGKIGDVVGGQGAQTGRAIRDVAAGALNAPAKIADSVFGTDRASAIPSQNVGNEFSGTISVNSAEWTTPEEFADYAKAGNNAAIAQGKAKNKEVTARMEAAGRQPGSWVFGRQEAALATSDKERQVAEHQDKITVQKYAEFMDPSAESPLEDMIQASPRGAAVSYLQDRETLMAVRPDLAEQVDRRMVPVLDAVEGDMQTETQQFAPGSPDHRRAQARLGNLQQTRNAIARGQPRIAEQAGIQPAGLKIADSARVDDVMSAIYNPERPVPTMHTAGSINAAATIAGRITPNGKRLNANQIESLSVLAEAGWMDRSTAFNVMMTGGWPPGKDPNAIVKIQAAGGTVYALTQGGGVITLPSARDKDTKGGIPNREFGEEQDKAIRAGMLSHTPGLSEANQNHLMSSVYRNPSWFRQYFNTTSQEDMRKLGIMAAENLILSSAQALEFESDWAPWTGKEDAIDPAEIWFQPEMRDKLANDFELTIIPMPDMKDTSGLDAEGARQDMREGRVGPTAVENEAQYSDEQVFTVMYRDALMKEEQERAAAARAGQ